ncbi:hypothetical protein IG631_13677 [Alternaria alternata]|nr:hypothetical protein IG631_13677 [Alternaria alternata]
MPTSSTNVDASPSAKSNDETTPLLTHVDPTPIDESVDPSEQQDYLEDDDNDKNKPLPKAQIFLLCYAVCAAPISFFSIFPYINFMIERVGGVDKEDVGFYSGLIESLFSATQMCVMILWGKTKRKSTGGALESPADKFTSTFGKTQFWHDYPYSLPNIVVSVIALSAAITTMLFVKETLHIHGDRKKTAKSNMSTWELVKYPGVMRVLVVYNYVMLMAFTFTAVFPVAQYTPISMGGLGFTTELIAACTALNGASQAAWLLIAFPLLHKRIGTGRVLWLCASAWPVLFVVGPVYNVLLRYGHTTVFWATGPPVIVLASGVSMAFTCVQLALNDISPSHETLGTLNAVALAAQSGIRSVAPALATSVYAIGVKYRILGGQLFWLCQVILAFGLFGLLKLLPAKARGDVKPKQSNSSA